MAGRNIKQLPKRDNPTLQDLFHGVSGDISYAISLGAVKSLFGITGQYTWNTDTLTYNSTNYIDTLVDSTVYGVVKIEYFAKRGSRSYRSGLLTVMYDGSQVVWNDYWDVTSNDNDSLGLEITARLNGSNFQLVLDVDGSDANDVTFNWKITTEKPITV